MAILTLMFLPLIIFVKGVPGNTTTFNVSLTVNSGSPSITYVQAVSDSPNEGTTKVVKFYFNASHPNGVSKIPASNAELSINRSGTTLTSSECSLYATDGLTTNMYECNITIFYYTSPGSWTINATITDTSALSAVNTSVYFTNGNTYGIALKTAALTFNGNAGVSDLGADQNPQFVNNTGNVGFNQINITAYDLQQGAEFIGVGNFTINTTNSGGPGHQLINNTPVTLANSSVAVGSARNLYLYLDVPSGTTDGNYTTVSQWVVTVS